MEKRDLTEYISRETLERLTGEAFEQFPEKGKREGFSRAAALAACVALAVMAVNFDTVYAAVREFLYFLPGSGTVTQETAADYWLPEEEYSAHTEAGDYFVTCLYRRGDTLSLQVNKEVTGLPVQEESDPPEGEADPSQEQLLREMAGEPAPDTQIPQRLSVAIRGPSGEEVALSEEKYNTFVVYDQTTGEAELEERWEFSDFTLDHFILVLDGRVEFSVRLRQIALDDYAVSNGTTAHDRGYAITLLPLNQNCTRFALITAPETEGTAPAGSYWSPVAFDIAATGESGREYQAESVNSIPGCQEFYLPEMPEERIAAITVTGILESTRYDKPAASVTLPALSLGEEVRPDSQVELWNFTLDIESAGLTPEGELWVRFRDDRLGDRWLNQIDLEWPEGPQRPTMHSTMEDDGYTTSCTGLEGRAGKRTTLPITFVSVMQKGLWEFRLPAG